MLCFYHNFLKRERKQKHYDSSSTSPSETFLHWKPPEFLQHVVSCRSLDCHREINTLSTLSVKPEVSRSLPGSSLMTTCKPSRMSLHFWPPWVYQPDWWKEGISWHPELWSVWLLSPQADWNAHLPWFSTTAKKPSMRGMEYQVWKCLSVYITASEDLRQLLCIMAKYSQTKSKHLATSYRV